ncbi:MAG: hypothetical protein L6R28_08900 [Planctomycetes bacterium]|nr:hypothetical protein [Planctomycetota bacterium]
MRNDSRILLAGLLVAAWCTAQGAEIPAEFQIKREAVYEFAAPPKVTRSGDRIEIAFETKGRCDVTVAIEDSDGNIVRHLASGVLGKNAPEPFQKDSLVQKIVWDGKDDLGKYIDDKDSCVIRVSLGLKPQFERTLFWCPQKRVGQNNSPIICPAPDGVYVLEGCGVDTLKVFDHKGDYLRTVYPFAGDKLEKTAGLEWGTFPQDGQKLPLKFGPKHRSTLLRSGDNMVPSPGKYGWAGNAMDVGGGRIAVAGYSLSRLATDGTTGGLDLNGPATALSIVHGGKDQTVQPRSAALSPDGKWLYLTGYRFSPPYPASCEWFPCVARVPFNGGKEAKPEIFKGVIDYKKDGSGNDQFKIPLGVACDSAGRVYVADFMNDRIQVFAEDGAFVKSIRTPKPVDLGIEPKSGEIYVASWMIINRYVADPKIKVDARYTRLGNLDDPKVLASSELPFTGYNPTSNWNRTGGLQHTVGFDFWAEKPTLWIIPGLTYSFGGWGVHEDLKSLKGTGLLLAQEEKGKLAIKRDFYEDTVEKVVRAKPPVISRQRLYVNPADGMLYIGEGDSGVMKSFMQLVAVNADSGKIKLVDLPMTTEDLAFDLEGQIYLRDDHHVARYAFRTWREVPYDYGEERQRIGFSDERGTSAVSCLVLPSTGRYGWWHLGGMAVNAKGNLAVTCPNFAKSPDRRDTGENIYAKQGKGGSVAGKKYAPKLFPGRVRGWETHIWDKHGQLAYEDALPGFRESDGIGLDKDDNLYVLANPNRVLNGEPYFLKWASTLVKAKPGQAKYLSASDDALVKLDKAAWPKAPRDVSDGWIEGAEWLYGGVGFAGWASGSSCICWNARPALDLLGRSFAPEVDHYSVAVLDTAGNLITRVGRYGNVDEGQPLAAEGGPKNTRSIGGDEVALFHAAYVGTHSDKRLFIADAGNNRILSVKLNYHAEQRLPLKDVPDTAATGQ